MTDPSPRQNSGPHVHAKSASAEERERRILRLGGRLSRLSDLRAQLRALEEEEKKLTEEIKADMAAGYYTTTDKVKPVLKPREQFSYDLASFSAHFGKEVTRLAVTIEAKSVNALIKQGVLSEAQARSVATVTKLKPALVLEPLSGAVPHD